MLVLSSLEYLQEVGQADPLAELGCALAHLAGDTDACVCFPGVQAMPVGATGSYRITSTLGVGYSIVIHSPSSL
jgi:hypothetical protein